MDIFLSCLYSFTGCLGFCLLFNIRGRLATYAALGGALSCLIFFLFDFLNNEITQSFIAIIITASYSEIMARIQKVPATIYLIISLIPLVPGGGVYYTMSYALDGNTTSFVEKGLHTIGIAGALAVGILIVSSLVHFYTIGKNYKKAEDN